MKWDKDGNQIWNQTWGGPRTDIINSIWGDENYIYLHGYTENSGRQLLLLKWDKDGNEIWNRTWGGAGWEYNYHYSMSSDGSYLYTTGVTSSFGNLSQIAVVKWDKDGNEIWNRTWGEEQREIPDSIWCGSDGIYVTGLKYGYDDDPIQGQRKVLIKWDFDGNEIWTQTWTEGEIITLWDDGSYLYGVGYNGDYRSYGISSDLILMKWYLNGTLVWKKTGNGFQGCMAFYITGDESNLYTTGYYKSDSQMGQDIFLNKWDFDGNLLWNWSWGTELSDGASSIYLDGNHIYIVGGIGSDFFGGIHALPFLVKINNEEDSNKEDENQVTIPVFSFSTITLSILLGVCGVIIIVKTKPRKIS